MTVKEHFNKIIEARNNIVTVLNDGLKSIDEAIEGLREAVGFVKVSDAPTQTTVWTKPGDPENKSQQIKAVFNRLTREWKCGPVADAQYNEVSEESPAFADCNSTLTDVILGIKPCSVCGFVTEPNHTALAHCWSSFKREGRKVRVQPEKFKPFSEKELKTRGLNKV